MNERFNCMLKLHVKCMLHIADCILCHVACPCLNHWNVSQGYGEFNVGLQTGMLRLAGAYCDNMIINVPLDG